jgi:membrane protein
VTVPLTRKLEALLWHPHVGTLPALSRAGVGTIRLVYAVLRDIMIGPLTLRAMGLVYVTILSLVPLLAVSFSVLKAFGMHRQLEPVLFEFLIPLGERGAELTRQIIGFVDNAQTNVLAGIGLLFLFFTAVSMAEQVEGSFNQIWRVERPRSLARRLSEYLSVILVGPVVMVTAMGLIASLQSRVLGSELSRLANMGIGGPAAELAPYVLVCLGFSFVYWFVPNTAVRSTPALVGGLVGGVLWAGTGAIFTAFVVDAATTINIYATFAIVITALFWLFLCWLILLVGAQVAFYVQKPDYLRIGYRQPLTGTGQQEQAALAIMLMVAMGFRDSSGSVTLDNISRATRLPGLALSPVISRLEAAGLLARDANERLLPKRDPARIRLKEIVHAIRHPEDADIGLDIHWPGDLARLTTQVEVGIDTALGEHTLAELAGKRGESAAG